MSGGCLAFRTEDEAQKVVQKYVNDIANAKRVPKYVKKQKRAKQWRDKQRAKAMEAVKGTIQIIGLEINAVNESSLDAKVPLDPVDQSIEDVINNQF